jgi:hypothetical protein
MRRAENMSRQFPNPWKSTLPYVPVGSLLIVSFLATFMILRSGTTAVFPPDPQRVSAISDPSSTDREAGYIYLLKADNGNLWYESSMNGGEDTMDTTGDLVGKSDAIKIRFTRSESYEKFSSDAIDIDLAGPASPSFLKMLDSPKGTSFVIRPVRSRQEGSIGSASVFLARSIDEGESFDETVKAEMPANVWERLQRIGRLCSIRFRERIRREQSVNGSAR